jgi:hypothetical protein
MPDGRETWSAGKAQHRHPSTAEAAAGGGPATVLGLLGLGANAEGGGAAGAGAGSDATKDNVIETGNPMLQSNARQPRQLREMELRWAGPPFLNLRA